MDNSGLFINNQEQAGVVIGCLPGKKKNNELGKDMNYSGETKVLGELRGWER